MMGEEFEDGDKRDACPTRVPTARLPVQTAPFVLGARAWSKKISFPGD